MKNKYLLIVSLIITFYLGLLSIQSIPASVNRNLTSQAYANGSVNWTGQGTSNGILNDSQCDANNTSYILWVFTVGGGTNTVTAATLSLGGSGSGNYSMSQTGNEWKVTTPFFALNSLNASVSYVGDLGNGNSNLVISHGCAGGTTPTPTPTNTPTPTITPTVTPTVTPTATPTNTPTPTPTGCQRDCGGNNPTPTPTDTPTITPTPTTGGGNNPTPTETPTPTPYDPGNPGGSGDGLSDGRSDGRSDGGSSGSQGSVLGASTVAKQGEVLGASTMAGTGTFESNLATIEGMIGAALAAIGIKLNGKAKSKKSK